MKNLILNLNKIILYCALYTPAMPKIQWGNINLYPLEILLVFFSPILFSQIRLKFQKILLALWSIVLISSVYSYLYNIELASLLRIIKYIVYIPIGYIAYKEYKRNHFILYHILYAFIICSIISFIIYGSNLSEATSMWGANGYNSGLSNKYFDLKQFTLISGEKGSHGVFGNYTCLVFSITIGLYYKKIIKFPFFFFIVLLTFINLMSSVSREALLCFSCIIIVWISKTIFKKKYISLYIITICLITYIIIAYGEYIPLINKIIYTQNALSENGGESNINLRFGAWRLFFSSLIEYPYYIITGYGYNLTLYENAIKPLIQQANYPFIILPESYFIQFLWFGGIFASMYSIIYWDQIFKICKNNSRPWNTFIKVFFIGLLINNIISGSSVTSDLLYCQILIILGFLSAPYIYEEHIIHYSKK